MTTKVTLDIDSTDNLSVSQVALTNMQRMLVEGTAEVGQNTTGSAITCPAIVKLVNRATVDDFTVATIAKAVVADFDDLMGVVVFNEDGGTSLANNDLGIVKSSGFIKINNSFSVGDMLWVDPSTSGNFTATPQTGYPPVGKCLVTGASGLILFDRAGLLRESQFSYFQPRPFVFTNATHNRLLMAGPYANFKITQAYLLSDTATTGSGAGTRWDFQLRNVTAAVNLLSTAKTTNGAEIAANTAYDLTPNQNQTIAANDVIRLEITKTGSPTDLSAADTLIVIEGQPV